MGDFPITERLGVWIALIDSPPMVRDRISDIVVNGLFHSILSYSVGTNSGSANPPAHPTRKLSFRQVA